LSEVLGGVMGKIYSSNIDDFDEDNFGIDSDDEQQGSSDGEERESSNIGVPSLKMERTRSAQV
jgi:hypothetical protein